MFLRWDHVIVLFSIVLSSHADPSNGSEANESIANSTDSTTNSSNTDTTLSTIPEHSTALISLSTSSPEQCPSRPVQLQEVDYNYGSINTFFIIAQNMCRKMQANLNEQYLEKLVNITLARKVEAIDKDEIITFLKEQVWAIILLIIGVAFIIFLPISGICFFCGRCCCNSCGAKRKHKHPSKICLCGYLVLTVIVLAVILASLVLYLQSISFTLTNVYNINKYVNSTGNDVTEVINIASSDLTCKLEMTLSKLFDEMKGIIWSLPPTVYGAFKNSSGFTIMQTVIDDLGTVSDTFAETLNSIKTVLSDLQQIPQALLPEELKNIIKTLNDTIAKISEVHKEYNNVYAQVNSSWNNLDSLIFSSNDAVNSTLKKADDVIDNAYNKTMQIIGTLNSSIDHINSIIQNGTSEITRVKDQIVTLPVHQAMDIVFNIVILVFALLIIVPTVIIIFCGTIRLFSPDKYPSKRPGIGNCSGYMGLFAVFVAFFTGWIVMLIAVVSFVGGYSLETVCRPLFYDPKMRLLREVPLLQFKVTNPIDKQNLIINTGDVMMECSENKTLLSALRLGNLLNVSAVMKKANIDGARDQAINAFKNTNLSYYFPESQFQELSRSFKQLKVLNDQLQKANIPPGMEVYAPKLADDYNNMRSNITSLINVVMHVINYVQEVVRGSLASGNFTDEGIQIFGELFNNTIAKVTGYVEESKDYLLRNSFACGPVYNIWENAGTVLCQKIGRPLQGLWASAGLMALCFLPAIIFITKIIKYLFKMDKKYDLRKQQQQQQRRIDGAVSYAGIFAYENSPRSSTLTLVSTCPSSSSSSGNRSNSSNGSSWWKLFRRKMDKAEASTATIERGGSKQCYTNHTYDTPNAGVRLQNHDAVTVITPPSHQRRHILDHPGGIINYWYSFHPCPVSPSLSSSPVSSISPYSRLPSHTVPFSTSTDRYPSSALRREAYLYRFY